MIRTILVGLCMTCAFAGATFASDLSPEHSFDIKPGVEWVKFAGPTGGEVIVILDRSGTLTIVDPYNGKQLLNQKLASRPGAELGDGYIRGKEIILGSEDAYAFQIFDLAGICSISISPSLPTGLEPRKATLTKISDAFPMAAYPGDPSDIKRLVFTASLGKRFVAARNDGGLATIDLKTRDVIQRRNIHGISKFQLFRKNDELALIWRHGGDVRLLVLSDPEKLEDTPIARFGETMPLWGALTKQGLVTASVDRVELWTREPTLVKRTMLPMIPLASAMIVTKPIAAKEDDEDAKVGPCFIFGDADGRLHAFDTLTGRRLWSVNEGKDDSASWLGLELAGDLLLAKSDRSAVVVDIRTGKRLADIVPAEQQVLSAVQREGVLYVAAWREKQVGGKRQVILYRKPLIRRSAARSTDRHFLKIDGKNKPLDVLWSKNKLVVVERSRISVYNLP